MVSICKHESKPLNLIQPLTHCKVFVLGKQFEVYKKNFCSRMFNDIYNSNTLEIISTVQPQQNSTTNYSTFL